MSIVCLVLNTASSINREKAFIVSYFLTIHTDFPKWWAIKFSSWEGLYYLCVDTNFINIYLCMWPKRNTVTLKFLNDLITDEKPTHRINRLPSMGSYSASVTADVCIELETIISEQIMWFLGNVEWGETKQTLWNCYGKFEIITFLLNIKLFLSL